MKKNETKKKKVKVKKSIKIIIIVVISLIVVGITSFFLIRHFTSITYKLSKLGYSKADIKILEKTFKEEELNKILDKKYHKDYVVVIKDKRFQKDQYLEYLDRLNKGEKKEDIINDLDPVVIDLRKKDGYQEEYLGDYLDYLDNNSDDTKVINYVNFKHKIKENKEYVEDNLEDYMKYYLDNETKNEDEIIKYINFKNKIIKNTLYNEKYLDKYMEYYMKNQSKTDDYVVKYINFTNELDKGKNYNKKYHQKYIDYYLKHMDKKIDDVISTVNADEKKKEDAVKAPSTEKPIDISQVDASKFKSATYYIADYQNRYVEYQAKNPSKSTSEVIRAVNSNIDYKFYTNMKSTKTSEGYLMLVNKFYTVGSSYVPSNLVNVTGGGKMEKTAAAQFEKMVQAAKKDGYTLKNVSGYRSYSTQKSLYNNYKARDGQTKADTYSARPGSSEHQTGLATDINTASSAAHFENTKTYKWLINNCYKYGFILRYPNGKTYITGYKFEPWHYRYVGVEAATYIHNHNITFEEYHAYFVSH